MNYYNPYYYFTPTMPRTNLFGRLFNNISFSRILTGTERAINFANQAIPLIKQVKPIAQNAKTILKVMNEFKKTNNTREYVKPSTEYNNGPKFFA